MNRFSQHPRSWRGKWLWIVLSGVLFVFSLGVWVRPSSGCCGLLAQTAVGSPFFSPLAPSEADLKETNSTIPPDNTEREIIYLPYIEGNLSFYLPLLYGSASNIPVPLVPAPGSTGQSLNTYFEWRVDNPSNPPPSYELYLEANVEVPRTLVSQTELQNPYLAPGTLLPDTQYAWQVVSIHPESGRVIGPVETFRTEGPVGIPDVEQMMVIPAGEFSMGCDLALRPTGLCTVGKDTPLHRVYLDAYAIDKYEVTNQQYRACVNARVCQPPLREHSLTRKSYFNDPRYDYFPVLFVSWRDAQTYCGWKGKRLPTEAEWEKAARGPIDTRTWPWGEEFPDCSRANFTDDRLEASRDWVYCVGDTTRVGSYPTGASPYGVMDVAGNAFEWVADRMDTIYNLNYYAISPYANPTGPQPGFEVAEGPFYVIRGGSYRPRWSYTRTFHRHHGHRGDASQLGVDIPLYRNNQVGFRCARPLDE